MTLIEKLTAGGISAALMVGIVVLGRSVTLYVVSVGVHWRTAFLHLLGGF